MADEEKPAVEEQAAPVLQEIATSADGRDISRPFYGSLLEPLDTVLSSLAKRWEAYREIRRDDQVHATFQQRRLAIVARPLVVEPGADDARSIAAADFLRANLQAIAFDRATKMMAWGFFYGFQPAECMWTRRDGKIWLDRVKVRTPWRFRFTVEGFLRLLTRSAPVHGEVMPDRKFWVMSSGADNDDEPYGLGIAHQLYWPVYFKKRGLAFWLRALEKFGAPTVVGTYPQGTPETDQAKLLGAAQAMRIDGAVIIPEGTLLELKEAMRGTVDQATFHRQMNAAIAKVTLGQTMTTDDGSSLAQGKVHFDVREELTDADVEDLCESFMVGPATWLTQWNFPGAATPKLSRPSPEDAAAAVELKAKKATTLKVMGEAGYEPDDETVKTDYPGWKRKPAPTPPPAVETPIADNVVPLRTAFSEPSTPDRDAIEDFVDGLDWEKVMEPVRDQLVAFFESATDLETAADQLGSLLAGPNGGDLVEQLARALFEARMAGEAGAGLSDDQDQAQATG